MTVGDVVGTALVLVMRVGTATLRKGFAPVAAVLDTELCDVPWPA